MIKSCGTSYVLLQGTEKEQASLLKEEMIPYTVDDLLTLKEHHAIFLQKYSQGYAKYIGHIPKVENVVRNNNIKKD